MEVQVYEGGSHGRAAYVGGGGIKRIKRDREQVPVLEDMSLEESSP